MIGDSVMGKSLSLANRIQNPEFRMDGRYGSYIKQQSYSLTTYSLGNNIVGSLSNVIPAKQKAWGDSGSAGQETARSWCQPFSKFRAFHG
jgi:hypothetical protein